MNKELEKSLKEVEKELFKMNFKKKVFKENNQTTFIPTQSKLNLMVVNRLIF